MPKLTEVSDSDTSNSNGGAGNSDAGALDPFDAAFEEAIASRGEPPASAAGSSDEDPNANAGQAPVNQPGSQGGNAEAEAGQNDQAAGGTPPAQQQSSDIWANAPAELREAYERDRAQWNHRLSSTQGRLSAADRELARLRKESGNQPTAQGGQPSGQAPANSLDDDEEIKRFQEEYGEIAGPVMKLLKAQADKIAQLEAPVAEVAQHRAIEAQASEFTKFATAHPDWEQYVNDARYASWLEQQPKAIRDAAQRAINIEDGQEAAWLLGQFKASIGVQASPPPSKPNPAPAPAQPSADPRRQRQLAAGRDIGGSSAPVTSGVPDDFDGAFDAIVAERERRNAGGQFR